MVQFPHCGNAARILDRPSAVVPGRIPSSLVRVTSTHWPSLSCTFVVMGTISSSDHPAFCAFSARWKLSAANLSMSSLVTLKSRLTFSLVHPMGCMQSAASWLLATTASSKGLSRRSPPIDMFSAPQAMPTSMEPEEMAWAMSAVALRPEEQNRLTELAPAVLGKPAARAAARSLYAALASETCEAQMVSSSR